MIYGTADEGINEKKISDGILLVTENSKKIFGFDINLEDFDFYFESRDKYLAEYFKDIDLRLIGKRDNSDEEMRKKAGQIVYGPEYETEREQLLKVEQDSLKLGGFYTPKLSRLGKIRHDITVLMNKPNADNKKLVSLLFLDTLAHEIGHALRFQEKEKNMKDTKIDLDYAKWKGSMECILREVRQILPTEERKMWPTRELFKMDEETIQKLDFWEKVNVDYLLKDEVNNVINNAEAVGRAYASLFPDLANLYGDKKREEVIPKKQRKRIGQLIRNLKDIVKNHADAIKAFDRKYTDERDIEEGWACYHSAKVLEKILPPEREDLQEQNQKIREGILQCNDAYGNGLRLYMKEEQLGGIDKAKRTAGITGKKTSLVNKLRYFTGI